MSLRTRLTIGFAAGMAVVLAALGLFVDWRVGHDLTAGIDMELRSRAQVIVVAVRANESDLVGGEGRLIDPDEAFAQVLDLRDRILDSSSAVREAPMMPADRIGGCVGRRSSRHGSTASTTPPGCSRCRSTPAGGTWWSWWGRRSAIATSRWPACGWRC